MSDYVVDTGSRPRTAILKGVFRLESLEAYDRIFAPISGLIADPAGYTVDLTEVVLMNSSGIRALADLVMASRRAQTPLTFLGKASIPWQSKTVASLQPLHAGLRVTLT